MLSRSRSRRKPRMENAGYWMSYSDMMAALLLMFVLLLFLSFNRYVTLQETRQAENLEKEAQLKAQEQALSMAQTSLDARESEIATIRSVLSSREVELLEKEIQLAQNESLLTTSQEELTLAQAELIIRQSEIDEQKRLLSLSEEEVSLARAQLDAYSGELSQREILLSAKDQEILLERLRVTDLETLLASQAVQIDELVGVRARIIEQLRDGFIREGLNIAVDESGAITMDSTVFFDTGKYALKDDGRALLSRLLPVYYRTLMSEENSEFVSEIIIEGHTDSVGSYETNLELSQRRAQAVVTYCLSDEFTGLTAGEKDQLRQMITANGRSKSQLIYDENGVEDRAASRRVELKFRLKDAEMVENMARILEGIREAENAPEEGMR